MGAAGVTAGLLAVVGPTATGKSDLAVELARRCAGEVVNADAMQLYRGMHIGTATLAPERRRGVPHHLLDVLDVTEPASVAAFQRHARRVVEQVRQRGRLPVLVGGSALYVHAVVDEMQFPGTDPRVRQRLETELEQHGPVVLHERLRRSDPAAAAAILPTNGRRIVRALEVGEITGRPFAATLPVPRYWHAATVQVGLEIDRAVLDARIAARVDAMWAAGFVDEVRQLERVGLREGRTAARALGYAQVLAFLAGECTEQQAREATVQATRRFARRQQSWWRRDPRVQWLAHDRRDLVDAALALARDLPCNA
jgi:tRNA dimethylallyltransferase